MGENRKGRLLGAVALSCSLALGAGCSKGPGGETTCDQFAAMGPNTGLGIQLTDKQNSVIVNMLSDHGKSTGIENISLAQLQITQYCNLYGAHAGSHNNDPVENIPGMQ